MFEQLRMGRALAADTEVARRVDDARAEMPFPNAIDDHARGNRLLHDRIGEIEPSAALRKRYRGAVAQNRQEVPRHFVSKIVGAAALADFQVDRVFNVSDAVDVRKMRRLRGAPCLDIGPLILDVMAALGTQLPLESPAAERQQARLG